MPKKTASVIIIFFGIGLLSFLGVKHNANTSDSAVSQQASAISAASTLPATSFVKKDSATVASPIAILPTIIAPITQSVSVASTSVKTVSKGTTVTYSGILSVSHTDDFLHKIETPLYQLLTNEGNVLQLVFANKKDQPTEAKNGELISISGVTNANKSISVTNVSFTGTHPTNTQVAKLVNERNADSRSSAERGAVRQYKVATILFNFQNTPNQTYSASDARHYIYDDNQNEPTSVAGYFDEATYGKIKITGSHNLNDIPGNGDVYGWYTLPLTDAGGCTSFMSWGQEAVQIAEQNGFSAFDYDSVTFVFPVPQSQCSFGGVESMMQFVGPGNQTTTKLVTFTVGGYQGNIVHELGHSLGLGHSPSLDCTDVNGNRIPYRIGYDACTSFAYGDPFDIMANTWRHFNVMKKTALGIFPNSRAITITNTTGASQYDLYPQEFLGLSGARKIAFKFDGADNFSSDATITPQDYLTLEYRRPYGVWDAFTPTEPVANGVTLRYKDGLIDTTPSTPTFDDAALTVGQSYTDPYSGRTISVLSANGTKATVSISAINPSAAQCNARVASYEPLETLLSSTQPFFVKVAVANVSSQSCSSMTALLPTEVQISDSGFGSYTALVTQTILTPLPLGLPYSYKIKVIPDATILNNTVYSGFISIFDSTNTTVGSFNSCFKFGTTTSLCSHG